MSKKIRYPKETKLQKIKIFIQRWSSKNGLKELAMNPVYLPVVSILLVLLEIVLNISIIRNVPYTEIDWKAYMQEVEGFLNGSYNYSELKGDTGPLVYPAGFVYIYSALYFITDRGVNLSLGQYIFAAIYILNLCLVLNLYRKSKSIPPFVAVLLCFPGYRIHSIYILRLFNDPVAMLLLYLSLNLFISKYWTIGSMVFSLSVSVKMNVLLYAPSLLVMFLLNLGVWKTIWQLFLCGSIQLMLGAPFLLHSPLAYIKGAFDLGRVFLFKWTVNWRFIPEEIFLNQKFHIALLAGHITCLCMLGYFLRKYFKLCRSSKSSSSFSYNFLLIMFACNFVGVTFSRSLHYQFYVWYFHTLPFLLWATSYSIVSRICILGIIELCWNTYPSTTASSLALHASHVLIIIGLVKLKRKIQ